MTRQRSCMGVPANPIPCTNASLGHRETDAKRFSAFNHPINPKAVSPALLFPRLLLLQHAPPPNAKY